METIEDGYKRFMESVFPAVKPGSPQWVQQRVVFFSSVVWVLGNFGDAVNAGINPIPGMRKESVEFLKDYKNYLSIEQDILKAGGL